MIEFRNMVITKKGRELMASVLSEGVSLEFTRVAVSEKNYTDAELLELETLNEIRQTGMVSKVDKTSNAAVKVQCAFDNFSVTAGYYIRSVALYAKVSNGNEFIYAACGASREAWMPPFNGLYPAALHFNLITTVGNTNNINLIVDSAAHATVGEIQNLQSQIDDIWDYLIVNSGQVYGLEVDFENDTYTRLGAAAGKNSGADFDSIGPWKRRRCNLTDDGVVTAYQNDDGYTETGFLEKEITVNGHSYPVGTPVQVMVEQPKFYYKVVPLKLSSNEENGYGYNLLKAQYLVSSVKFPGFRLHPAFIYNGIENDKIYIAAYKSIIYDSSTKQYVKNITVFTEENIGNYKFSSASNEKSLYETPDLDRHYDDLGFHFFDQMTQNRGSGWTSEHISIYSVSILLALIEYASFNLNKNIKSYRGAYNTFSSYHILYGIYFSVFDQNGKYKSQYYTADHGFENTPMLQTYPNDSPLDHEPPVPLPFTATGISAPDIKLDPNQDTSYLTYDFKYYGYSDKCDWLFLPSGGGEFKKVEECSRFFSQCFGTEGLTGLYRLAGIMSPTEDNYMACYSFFGKKDDVFGGFVHRLIFIPSNAEKLTS